MATLYLDTFTGSAEALDVHVPDTGGAYYLNTEYGGAGFDGPADLNVDGSGNLLVEVQTPSAVATSLLTSSPSAGYSLEFGFTTSSPGGADGWPTFYFIARGDGISENLIAVGILNFPTIPGWALSLVVSDSGGNTLYSSGNVAFTATGGAQVILVNTSASGTELLLDDAPTLSTAQKPDVAPDSVMLFPDRDLSSGPDMLIEYAHLFDGSSGSPTIGNADRNSLRPGLFAPGISR